MTDEGLASGTELLTRRLRQSSQPVPIGLGRRGDTDEAIVNDFAVRLVAHSRHTGRGYLYQWRHALDTAAWLHRHGLHHISACGHGM